MDRGVQLLHGFGALVCASVLLVACAAPAAPARPADQLPAPGALGQTGSAPTSTPAPARVRIAYVTVASNILPMWLAQDEGIFTKYGLDVEL
ncbi:MAG: hypothetical protein JO054_05065, partial [Actinobacteria bacterium]|nr:hypothetical protein [Actinomycetota bacterium]